jgi:hypothetical protein
MIDRSVLLRDLQKEVTALEDAIAERIADDPNTTTHLRAEHETARAAGRTAETFEMWRGEQVTQSAVAWVLACVFIRFLEDNELLPAPHLSGPDPRRQLALDQRQLYFQHHPTRTDREYLHHVFREVATLPAAGDLLGEKHNPLWALAPTGDGAARLLAFFQRIVPETGEIAHDFTDPSWSTRFLGDLYQDLSEAARKKFALLQTPEFVEEFILDRTLTPAIDIFGYQEVRLIDPTCGSGHFLLGAFHRLFALHQQYAPGTNARELAQRALDQVAGVDLNPFAVAIARFRLLLAALRVSGITRLADAPGFHMHLAVGDSLLHGRRFGLASVNLQPKLIGHDPLRHVYEAEDSAALRQILGRQYHAVVGNPPYITVKDKALNQAYRDAYQSCHMKYSLGAPFTERFFELALTGRPMNPAGFVGMITANSFMKREFGSKLIEEVLPKIDLTHVVDTSGAYIPGHGTPTVILFGRNQGPGDNPIRAVMGIRGEPSTPADPALGEVWRSIVTQIDSPGSETAFVSVSDIGRGTLSKHPWSIGGGGAAELKALLEDRGTALGNAVAAVGITAVTGEDSVYMFSDQRGPVRLAIEDTRLLVTGERIRDWSIIDPEHSVWLYDETLVLRRLDPESGTARYLWPYRAALSKRKRFGTPMLDRGLTWYEWQELYPGKLRTPLSIAFAFVATHNHFVLDRGGKVFNRSAPVIKLPTGATEDDHLPLLGLLNSSTACFWMKQVFYPKATASGDISTEKGKPEANRYEFAGTELESFPLPPGFPACSTGVKTLARQLDAAARDRDSLQPARVISRWESRDPRSDLRSELRAAELAQDALRAQLVALQEELDWEVYRLYGLSDTPSVAESHPPLAGVSAEHRPFAWPSHQPPPDLPPAYVASYTARRIALVENADLRLIETRVFKRPWLGRQGVYGSAAATYPEKVAEALREWLASRLEASTYWPTRELTTGARLADRARGDALFMEAAATYRGHPDFEVSALVADILESESVPALARCRYTTAGVGKHEQWQHTWALQRAEDHIDRRTTLDTSHPGYLTEQAAAPLKRKQVGEIAVSPKFKPTDFQRARYWTHRDKLDVPKERFISFPHCQREGDSSLVVGWAGWNHLQQAEAIAAYYVAMKDTEGWAAERLTPILAALRELVPWLEQWHNDLHPEYSVGMGEYYRGFVETETRALGLTPEYLTGWKPPAAKKKGKAKVKAGQQAS